MDPEEAMKLLELVAEYQASRDARSPEWDSIKGEPEGRDLQEIAADVARLLG